MNIIKLSNLIDMDFVNKLIDMGFVPSIIIVGGWFYAIILTLIFLYNLLLYIFQLLIHQAK